MLQALGELAVEFVLSLVIEGLVRVPGYYILRALGWPPALEFESDRVLLTGFLLWAAIVCSVGLVVWLR